MRPLEDDRDEPSSSQGERQVRPRLRALRWKKKESEEEVVRVEQETKPNPQKEIDEDQTIQGCPAVQGQGSAHGKPRKRRFRDFPVDAVDLESTRLTVKLFAGESRLGLKRIEEDSWTARVQQGEGREAVFGGSEGGFGDEDEGEGVVFIGPGKNLGDWVCQGWPGGARN